MRHLVRTCASTNHQDLFRVPVEVNMNTKLDWFLAKLLELDCLKDKSDRLEDKINNYESRLQEINNRLTSPDNKITDVDEKLVGKASLTDFGVLDECLNRLELLGPENS